MASADPGSDPGLLMCDQMLHELAGEHGLLKAGSKLPHATIEDIIKDPAVNPNGRILDATESLSLKAALAPIEQELGRAAHRSEVVKWTTLKDLIGTGRYVRVASKDDASFDALLQQEILDYEKRTGVRSGLNVMVAGIAGARADESRLIVFVRGGQGAAYLESLDEVQRLSERRKTLVREFLSGLPPR